MPPDLHDPHRPDWACGSCGEDWPCPPRRARMLANRTPFVLSLEMAEQFELACSELEGQQAGVLYQRFMGWIPRRRALGVKREQWLGLGLFLAAIGWLILALAVTSPPI